MRRPLSRAKYADDENMERVLRSVLRWRSIQDKHFDDEGRKVHMYPEERALYNAATKWWKAMGKP